MAVTAGGILGLIAAGIAVYIVYRIVKRKMKGGIKSYAHLEYPKEETAEERRDRQAIARSGEGIEGTERGRSTGRGFKFTKPRTPSTTTPSSDGRESDVETTAKSIERIDVDKRDSLPKRKFKFSS